MGKIKGIGVKANYEKSNYVLLSEICEAAGDDAKIRSDESMKMDDYENEFNNLCKSIMKQGQIKPVTLRPLTDEEKKQNKIGPSDNIHYAIKDGRTRIKALKKLQDDDKTNEAEYKKVLAIITTDNNTDTDRITAAIANFSRVEMSEYDKAKIVKDMQKQQKADNKNSGKKDTYKIRDIAEILGVSRSYIGKLAKMEFDEKTHERISTTKENTEILDLTAAKDKLIKENIIDQISAIKNEKDIKDVETTIKLADELKDVISVLSAEVARINKFSVIRKKRISKGRDKVKE